MIDTENYEINKPKIKKLINGLNDLTYMTGINWKFENGFIKKYFNNHAQIIIPLVPLPKTDASTHITVRNYPVGVPYEVEDVHSIWLAVENDHGVYDLNEMMAEYIDRKAKIKVTVIVQEMIE